MGCKKNGKEEDEWRRGGADCGRIRREKSKNGGVIGYREEGRRKMNGVRGGSGLRTDLNRKEQK